jgi:glycosyltransferase involved in cell wall biosynthesis
MAYNSTMKKILYAITKSNFGGAQRYVYELALEAKEAGFDVEVACGGTGSLIAKLNVADIPVHSMNSAQRDIHVFKEFATLLALYGIIRKVRPDIIHLNSPKLGGLGSVVARFAGVKNIIYTNHGWPFMESRPIWQKVLIKFFSWLTILFNRTVIVLSKKEFEMVRRWPGALAKHRLQNGTVVQKLMIIPIGVKPFYTYPKEESLARLLGEEKSLELIKRDARILGNISELTKNKGYQFALEGLKQYKEGVGPAFNSHFIMVSDGEESERLRALVKELGLEDDVTMTGYVLEAREFVKAFDLFLLSSVKEGLPYCILEAGFAEVPVISTDVGGISEVIENLQTGFLIQPGRSIEIKNILTYIDDHSGEERRCCVNLKAKIDAEFSFEEMVGRTLNLY